MTQEKLKEIHGANDLDINTLSNPIAHNRTDPVVEALATDTDKIGVMMKLSVLTPREQFKARRTIDAAFRLGATNVLQDTVLEIQGAPGRWGHRAEQLTALGGASAGYGDLAMHQKRGLLGSFKDMLLGRKAKPGAPPDPRRTPTAEPPM